MPGTVVFDMEFSEWIKGRKRQAEKERKMRGHYRWDSYFSFYFYNAITSSVTGGGVRSVRAVRLFLLS